MKGIKVFICMTLAIVLSIPVANAKEAKELNIVEPKQIYSYEEMVEDMRELAEAYPDIISYTSLGKSPYGRDIYALKLGKGEATVFFNGSHHAREHMTTNLLMEMVDTYAWQYENWGTFEGYDVRTELNKTTIWIVPMVNPDGVTLQQEGIDAFPKEVRAKLIKMNDGSTDFTRWKANAQGIDLNRQYPGGWDNIVANPGKPYWWNYPGTKPLEAPEAKLLYNFTYEIKPEIAVSYHSSGRILYWNFKTKKENLERDEKLATEFSKTTGYSLVKPRKNPSGGGFTDWFITEFGQPAFTPEVGNYVGDKNLPLSAFDTIWEENNSIGLWLASESYDLWLKKNKDSKKEPYKESLLINKTTVLYEAPGFGHGTGITIAPQKVVPFERISDWYHIKTWIGDKWIFVPRETLGETEVFEETVQLLQNHAIYKIPFDKSSKLGELAPQTLKVNKRLNQWYEIDSWLGKVWIDLSDREDVLLEMK